MTTTSHYIRCGRCKGSHESTEQVKACYAVNTEVPATEKQRAFITRLLEERPTFARRAPRATTKVEASQLIDQILSMPKEVDLGAGGESSLTALLRDVPDGYYAFHSRTGTNDLDFITVVSRGEKRFIHRYLGGQGSVLIRSSEQREFAKLLAERTELQRAQDRQRFGRELGRCGVCGRPLTDQTSRARGVGPDCWSKL